MRFFGRETVARTSVSSGGIEQASLSTWLVDHVMTNHLPAGLGWLSCGYFKRGGHLDHQHIQARDDFQSSVGQRSRRVRSRTSFVYNGRGDLRGTSRRNPRLMKLDFRRPEMLV